ncbi:MAG TPA: hypothetical protein VE890_04565 [Thermoguttaceae bacterium]|nr:hypothetical protein [Thermoguttaceae bacterium]
MQNPPLAQSIGNNVVGRVTPLRDLSLIEQQDIHRYSDSRKTLPNRGNRAPPTAFRRKWLLVNNQEIDIRVFVRCPSHLRAE